MKAFPEGCVAWPAKLDKDGYGCLLAAGEKRAHRVFYRLFIGDIPRGMQVLHSCDNPSCVNPRHLSLGTIPENMKQRTARGRQPRGADHANAKLKAAEVALIRGGLDLHSACARFGITKSTYYRAKNGESYGAPGTSGK